MTAADVILTTAFSPVPASSLALFQRPTRVVTLPTPPSQGYQAMVSAFGSQPVRGILQKYAPDVTPLRVAAMGFSESCQFPRAILRSADGGRMDAAIAIDGIHAQFAGNGSHTIAPGYLEAWEGFASLAAQGGPLLVITTSSIVPPFVSTTETSNAIWRTVTGSDDDREDAPPEPSLWDASLSPVRYRNAGSLYLYNYAGTDAAAHILQAQKVLPLVLADYLAARWNTDAGTPFPDGYLQGAPDYPVPGVTVVPGGTVSPVTVTQRSFLQRIVDLVSGNPVASAVVGGTAALAVGIGVAAARMKR